MNGISFTPIDKQQAVSLFMHSLSKLKMDDTGLLPGHDLKDLNTIAFLAGVVRLFAGAHCETVEDMFLGHLADCTEALLVSAAAPAVEDVVANFWRARADVVECQLGGL